MSLTPMTSLYTSTQCNLVIQGTTITGDFRHSLRLAVSEPPLFEYLREKHGWDDPVIDDIDWDSFCMAARSYPPTEVHLLKLVHDKLPFCHQVSRHQKWTTSECHYCSNQDTMDHLQCGACNPASFRFCIDLFESLREYLTRRHCSKLFEDMFLTGLAHWVDPKEVGATLPAPSSKGLGTLII